MERYRYNCKRSSSDTWIYVDPKTLLEVYARWLHPRSIVILPDIPRKSILFKWYLRSSISCDGQDSEIVILVVCYPQDRYLGYSKFTVYEEDGCDLMHGSNYMPTTPSGVSLQTLFGLIRGFWCYEYVPTSSADHKIYRGDDIVYKRKRFCIGRRNCTQIEISLSPWKTGKYFLFEVLHRGEWLIQIHIG
jgi:hypothetical protein